MLPPTSLRMERCLLFLFDLVEIDLDGHLPAKEAGLIIPVVITVYTDRTFTFITKTPPAPVLIKKELNLQKASGRPNKEKVGQLKKEQVRKIAEIKMPDLNAGSIEAAMSMVAGTARSMGVTVEE